MVTLGEGNADNYIIDLPLAYGAQISFTFVLRDYLGRTLPSFDLASGNIIVGPARTFSTNPTEPLAMATNGLFVFPSIRFYGPVGPTVTISLQVTSTYGFRAIRFDLTNTIMECTRGNYLQNVNGFSYCQACPDNTYSLSSSQSWCYRCPASDEASCNSDNVFTTSDRWRLLTPKPVTFIAADGRAFVSPMEQASFYICPAGTCNSRNKCGPHRLVESPLCGTCEDGYSEWEGQCLACENGVNAGLVVGMLVVFWVFVLVYHLFSESSGGSVRIVIYFAQVLLLILPADALSATARPFLSILAFRPTVFGSSSCLYKRDSYGYYFSLTAMALFASVFLLLTFAIEMAYRFVREVMATRRPTLIDRIRASLTPILHEGMIGAKSLRTILSTYLRTLVLIILFGYQTVSEAVFQFLTCIHVGQHFVGGYLPSIDCSSSRYHSWAPYYITLSVVVVFGLPLAFLLMLLKYRTRMAAAYMSNSKKSVFRGLPLGISVVVADYRLQCFWWEVVVLVRRAALVAVHALVTREYSQQPSYRAFAMTILCLIVWLGHEYSLPFTSSFLNVFESLSLFGLCIVGVCVLFRETDPSIRIDLIVLAFFIVLIIGVSLHLLIKMARRVGYEPKIPFSNVLSSHMSSRQHSRGWNGSNRSSTLASSADATLTGIQLQERLLAPDRGANIEVEPEASLSL
jgi:hypothetical protein